MRLQNEGPVYVIAAYRFRGCPCCGTGMRTRWGRNNMGLKTPANLRTKGHDRPVSRGGRLWIWVCHRCNNDQGDLTFRSWAYELQRDGDRRAPRVMEVAQWLSQFTARPTDAGRTLASSVTTLAAGLSAPSTD